METPRCETDAFAFGRSLGYNTGRAITTATEMISNPGKVSSFVSAIGKLAMMPADPETPFKGDLAHEKRAVWFQDMVGVNANTGAVVRTWAVPYKGKYKEPLDGDAFYTYLGRQDLAEQGIAAQVLVVRTGGVVIGAARSSDEQPGLGQASWSSVVTGIGADADYVVDTGLGLIVGRAPLGLAATLAASAMLLALATALFLYSQASVLALVVLGGTVAAGRLARGSNTIGEDGRSLTREVVFCLLPAAAALVIARIDAGPISLY